MIEIDTRTGICTLSNDQGFTKTINLNDDFDMVEEVMTYPNGNIVYFGKHFLRSFLNYCRQKQEVVNLQDQIQALKAELNRTK